MNPAAAKCPAAIGRRGVQVNIERLAPVFDGLSLADACDYQFAPGLIAQEKIDGIRAWLDCDTGALTGRNVYRGQLGGCLPRGCVFDGEMVKDTFHAFDLLKLNGQNLRGEPLGFRLNELAKLRGDFRHVEQDTDCQALARRVSNRGGEGIVTKRADSTYLRGGWLRYKREATLDVTILNVDVWKKSAEVALNGESVGRIFGFNETEIEQAAPGQVVEVKAIQLTAAGKLRSARFLRFRADKV